MLESSSLSIDDDFFAPYRRETGAGRKRHVAQAFATISWFHQVRLECRATSVYQLATAFGDPDASRSGPTAGDKTKWRGYKHGSHTPSDVVVCRVEGRCKKGTGILRHVLWSALGLPELTADGVMSILVRLDPDIYGIAWRCMTAGTGQLSRGDGWDDIRISMLERRAWLDALAALILAARWAKTNGHERSNHKLCGAICRTLLVLGPWLYNHGVARPLVEFVEHTVLVDGGWYGRRHQFWSHGYMNGLRSLVAAASYIDRRSPRRSEADQIKLLRELVAGGHGAGRHCLVVDAE